MPGISFPRVTTGHSQGPVPPAGAGFLLLSKMGIVLQLGTTAVLATVALGRGWELGVRQGRVPPRVRSVLAVPGRGPALLAVSWRWVTPRTSAVPGRRSPAGPCAIWPLVFSKLAADSPQACRPEASYDAGRPWE